MKKLSLMLACAIFSTAMFAGTPGAKDQGGKSSKPSKSQTVKHMKPVRKQGTAVQVAPGSESKVNKKK